MITLLAPESENLFTGGYLYNCRITREMDPSFFTGIMLKDPPPAPEELPEHGVNPESMLLLDSLYLKNPDWVSKLGQIRPGGIAMIVHYLPSLDPFINRKEAEKYYNGEKLCFESCRCIAATSNYLAEKIRSYFKNAPPVSVFHPAMDIKPGFKRRQKSSELILLTVAGWTAAKNHQFMIDILKNLKPYPWRWKIYGAGNESLNAESFRKKAAQAGIAGRIDIYGAIEPEEVRNQMINADIYLSPSLFESYGMSVAEAMAASLPVIANRTGGIPEASGDSEGAYLCTPDDREEWIAVLQELIESPAKRQIMSDAAEKRACGMRGWRETAESLFKFLDGVR